MQKQVFYNKQTRLESSITFIGQGTNYIVQKEVRQSNKVQSQEELYNGTSRHIAIFTYMSYCNLLGSSRNSPRVNLMMQAMEHKDNGSVSQMHQLAKAVCKAYNTFYVDTQIAYQPFDDSSAYLAQQNDHILKMLAKMPRDVVKKVQLLEGTLVHANDKKAQTV